MSAPTNLDLMALSREQYDSLLTARGHHLEVKDVQLRLESSQAGLARAIYEALEKGVKSSQVADFLGIGETSVRRMRDQIKRT